MTDYIIAMINIVAGRIEKSERGATAVEYGIMVALIAAVIIATVVILGTQIRTAFQTITAAL